MNALPRLPSIRELIKLYGLSANSQLSQNFILDRNITGKKEKEKENGFFEKRDLTVLFFLHLKR